MSLWLNAGLRNAACAFETLGAFPYDRESIQASLAEIPPAPRSLHPPPQRWLHVLGAEGAGCDIPWHSAKGPGASWLSSLDTPVSIAGSTQGLRAPRLQRLSLGSHQGTSKTRQGPHRSYGLQQHLAEQAHSPPAHGCSRSSRGTSHAGAPCPDSRLQLLDNILAHSTPNQHAEAANCSAHQARPTPAPRPAGSQAGTTRHPLHPRCGRRYFRHPWPSWLDLNQEPDGA